MIQSAIVPLQVARKPIVQYVVEELVRNGISQILFVTGRNKTSIENTSTMIRDLPDELGFEGLRAHSFYTRQRMQRGLGDAILCGENFAGEGPFLVALGDSILGLGANSKVVTRLIEVFESASASAVIAMQETPPEGTSHYGIVKPDTGAGDVFRLSNLVDKPKPRRRRATWRSRGVMCSRRLSSTRYGR